ncbi:MAG TPA: chemotaxis protein CheW [Rhodanobacteraceae bacterium]|nr:chemotaxis protein CheW [Rhodanobacteraceae bacterium]
MSKKSSRKDLDTRKGEPARGRSAAGEGAADVQLQGAYALLADYERRSLEHDPGVPEQIEAPGLWRAIGFRVGDHHFVSGIDEISEILMSPPPVTSIPSTRPWLLGVANVRGNLIALVDLRQFLFEQRTHVTGRARVLVVKQGGGNVGLLVDELIGQRNLTDADREGAEGESDPSLARFVTENVMLGAVRLGRFSMVELTHAAEFQHAAL